MISSFYLLFIELVPLTNVFSNSWMHNTEKEAIKNRRKKVVLVICICGIIGVSPKAKNVMLLNVNLKQKVQGQKN